MAPRPRRHMDLIDDAITEILLRLPPDEPEHLFRAALVCKPWLRILCDPGFLHRYHAFHGAPPLLGLLRVPEPQFMEFVPSPGFVPTTSMRAFPNPPGSDDGSLMRVLDCRHGRLLLHIMESWDSDVEDQDSVAEPENQIGAGYLLAWDPVTGDSHVLPNLSTGPLGLNYTAVLFCTAKGCHHLDCHRSPFCVAFLKTKLDSAVACIYSSETGTWSAPTCGSIGTAKIGRILARHGAIIGDEVYLIFSKTTMSVMYANGGTFVQSTLILRYDWRKNCLSLIDPPPHPEVCNGSRAFMVTEDGSLGLSVIVDSSLCIWSRKVSADGSAEWVRRSVVDLKKVIPMVKTFDCCGASIVGFAEGAGAVFVNTNVGLFTIELKSRRVKKIGKPESNYSLLPYMRFYTPDRGTLSSLARLTDV